MIIRYDDLSRLDKDTVSGLIIGYEADALSGIPIREQVERLLRWKKDGWSIPVYYCNIIAMMIGYQKAKMQQCTT